MHRRMWLKAIASAGVGGSVFHRALAAEAAGNAEITAEMVRQAQWVAGVELSEEEQEQLAQALGRREQGLQALRQLPLEPFREPATTFKLPIASRSLVAQGDEPVGVDRIRTSWEIPDFDRPDTDEALAFCSITQLASLLRRRLVTSVELTRLYLERLKKFDPLLKCVVSLTEELALRQAAAADRELARGKVRGPLHGIPWGAKDLISVPGYPTTWGVPQFADRRLEESATVYEKLTAAGAVLVAKLSLGALAMGDRWHGGMTRNPWAPEQGSSGSSAGSASAVAAGLVGFAIGSETLGSILSPSRVCGSTGLRPTFGLVGRGGCMPLSWTMDKLGPMARTAEDTALVLSVISGVDPRDNATCNVSNGVDFRFPRPFDPSRLRVGYVQRRRRGGGDAGTENEVRPDLKPFQEMGCQLVEVSLPSAIPARLLTFILEVEGASVFEQWLNQGQTEGWNAWPGIFRSAQFVTALDYLRAQRLRGQLVQEMQALFDQVDVLVNANDLVITNLTGHPSLSFVDRYREVEGRLLPQPCVLTGRLFEDDLLATLAWQVQQRWDQESQVLQQRPPLEADLEKLNAPPETPTDEETSSGQANGAQAADPAKSLPL